MGGNLLGSGWMRRGGINLEALVKQFGDAKIWATECSRCFTSLPILLALAGLACVTITSWHSPHTEGQVQGCTTQSSDTMMMACSGAS